MSTSFDFLKAIASDDVAGASEIFNNLVAERVSTLRHERVGVVMGELVRGIVHEALDPEAINSVSIEDLNLTEEEVESVEKELEMIHPDILAADPHRLVNKHPDRNGNGDDVFNASNIKQAPIGGPELEHGYSHDQAKAVYK